MRTLGKVTEPCCAVVTTFSNCFVRFPTNLCIKALIHRNVKEIKRTKKKKLQKDNYMHTFV